MRDRIDVRARLVAATLPDEPEFSTARLAKILGIDFETVGRATRRGELPPPVRRTKHRWVYERETLCRARGAR